MEWNGLDKREHREAVCPECGHVFEDDEMFWQECGDCGWGTPEWMGLDDDDLQTSRSERETD